MSDTSLRATVDRDGEGLVVTWTGEDPVAVHVSTSPTELGPDRHVPAESGRLTLDRLDPASRYYIHLVWRSEDTVVVAERLVPLEGTLNFRDLGGYVGAGGRRVRWGRVFRSDHLGALTETDVALLERLAVRTVVDFQGSHEYAGETRRALPAGSIRRLHRPIIDGPAEGVTFYDRVMDRSLTHFEVEDLTDFYLGTLERSAATFGEVLGLMADPGHHSVVFHCRAGKDRTGLTAALLLGVLGVGEDDILDDYVLTNRYRSGRRVEVLRPQLATRGIDIDALWPLFVAPREAMAGTLAGLVKRYGSVEDYLRTEAGLTGTTLADLRRHLLA